MRAKFNRKSYYLGASLCLAMILSLVIPMQTVQAIPAATIVYDAIPNPLPPNMPSVGFQATQASEFGDYVHLTGTNRELRTVTVTMSDWALNSDYPAMPSIGWDHPITLNIYNAVAGTPLNTLGSLLGTMTQTITIPWRPAEDPTNCPTKDSPGYAYKWQSTPGAPDTNCYNGFAFNITFDMSSLNVTLPNDVIVGVAYNTQSYGAAPIGAAGPYNSLNVGATGVTTAGTDDNTDNVFYNTATAAWYTDGGTGGVGIFREDTAWTPNGTVPIQITVASSTVYVDDSWAGTSSGDDPDGAGPATSFGTDAFATIQDGIDAVATGGTVNVAAGMYIEIGQIVIDKNLTIVGADKTTTIIKPAGDTGTDGDSRGWFLVNIGVTFNLSNVTLDGAGRLVSIAINSHGPGTIDNNIIQNMGYHPSGPDYAGRAIALWDANMTVSNNTILNFGRIGIYVGSGVTAAVIDGNTITGKGPGDHLDYGIEIGRGGVAEVENNTVSNCRGIASVDGSTSAGMLATTFFAPGTSANVHDNIFSNNSTGILVGYDASDTTTVTAHHNQLTGNGAGITSTAPAVNAEENWWGAASGPGPVGPGTGDTVSTNVYYSPWCTDAACTTFVPPYATTTTITYDGPDPSRVGQASSVAVTVTGGPTPTGTVNITGADTNCMITLSGGMGSCMVNFASDGPKTLTATYNGDGTHSTSSDTEPHTVTLVVTFQSIAADDGWILESGENTNAGGTMNSAATTLRMGDDASNKQYRSILSFNTAPLPGNAVIVSIMLQTTRQNSVGDPNFTDFGGRSFVDVKNPTFGAASLELADFITSPTVIAGGHQTTPIGNLYRAYFNAASYSSINLVGLTQIRIRFKLDDDNDHVADYFSFYSGNAATVADRPLLQIMYYTP